MEEQILKKLKRVIDPELGINIVDLGLIYKIKEKEGKANILMTLTSPGCPLAATFKDMVKKAAMKVEGIKKVSVKLTFNPLWTPRKMSEKARLKFG